MATPPCSRVKIVVVTMTVATVALAVIAPMTAVVLVQVVVALVLAVVPHVLMAPQPTAATSLLPLLAMPALVPSVFARLPRQLKRKENKHVAT